MIMNRMQMLFNQNHCPWSRIVIVKEYKSHLNLHITTWTILVQPITQLLVPSPEAENQVRSSTCQRLSAQPGRARAGQALVTHWFVEMSSLANDGLDEISSWTNCSISWFTLICWWKLIAEASLTNEQCWAVVGSSFYEMDHWARILYDQPC